MTRRLPTLAWLLGLAGLIPFIGCGLATITAPPDRAAEMLQALIAYGAVILSFLGAVHWGFALDEAAPLAGSGGPAEQARLLMGILPALLGWVALLLPLAVPAEAGLGALIVGYAGTALAESRGYRRKLVPGGYMVLRWILTIVVLVVLVAVLVVRLSGARVSL